ncbi:MAG TPA: hypothetical protein ENN84_00975 [Candidatus Marinimicrobia bacterium]|nr:hypothetical protein [Candidatus Neomarinimicrobiota bacterium]
MNQYNELKAGFDLRWLTIDRFYVNAPLILSIIKQKSRWKHLVPAMWKFPFVSSTAGLFSKKS